MIVAIIPAAGQSRRMGRPKLVLEIGGTTVIQRVISAMKEGGAGRVLVVGPPDAEPGALQLAELAREAGAHYARVAASTPDMRATIESGLDQLDDGSSPLGVLIAPADSIGMTPQVVRAVVERFRQVPGRIVIPVHDGKRGHPLALPWSVAKGIRELPAGVGVNAILATREADIDRLPVNCRDLNADLDTPEDYRRWAGS